MYTERSDNFSWKSSMHPPKTIGSRCPLSLISRQVYQSLIHSFESLLIVMSHISPSIIPNSVQRVAVEQQQQPSLEVPTTISTTCTTGKKKFGKNLTKLVQSQLQVAPTDTRNGVSSVSNRNGLLLLSTNKKSSGLLSSERLSLSHGSGFLSGGAPQKEIAPLDAWGVNSSSTKVSPSTVELTNRIPPITPAVANSSQHPLPSIDTKSTLMPDTQISHSLSPQKSSQQPVSAATANENSHENKNSIKTGKGMNSTDVKDGYSEAAPLPSKSWDEYGGRGKPNNGDEIREIVPASSLHKDKEVEEPPKSKGRLSDSVKDDDKSRNRDQSRNLESKPNHATNVSNTIDQSGNQTIRETAKQDSLQQASFIHLNSYEDQDRGMSAQPNQPRMLFDPKSGSMVAVKAKEPQVSKAKNVQKKVQEVRTSSNKLPVRAVASNGMNKDMDRKGRNASNADSFVKVQLLKNSNPSFEQQTISKIPSAPIPILTRVRRSLPRTCGVLYKRNKVGNTTDDNRSLQCVDGCDGDLGYGAHSVPGGRIRNQQAYAKYKEEQQQQLPRNGPSYMLGNKQRLSTQQNSSYSVDDHYTRQNIGDDSPHGASPRLRHEGSFLFNGLNTDLATESIEYDSALHQLDWVTADDKLEIVGREDDEPTLKPTAKVFAPSTAALAAAATMRALDSPDSDTEEDYDDDFHHQTALGILEDDDDEVVCDHTDEKLNRLQQLRLQSDGDQLALGFDDIPCMNSLIENSLHGLPHIRQMDFLSADEPFSKTRNDTIRINVDNQITLPEELNSNAYSNRANHAIFSFGSSGPWGSTSNTTQNNESDNANWTVDNILNLPGLDSHSRRENGGIFAHSDNDFEVHSLVGGIPSNATWGGEGLLRPSLESLNVMHENDPNNLEDQHTNTLYDGSD